MDVSVCLGVGVLRICACRALEVMHRAAHQG